MSCPSTRLLTATVLTGVTTPSALTYTPMSPFLAVAVETRIGGGAPPALGVFGRALDRPRKTSSPTPAMKIIKITTIHRQPRGLAVETRSGACSASGLAVSGWL